MNIKSIILVIPLVLEVVAAQGNDKPNLGPTATDCLAAVIYKEARGENLRGKLAVAQVVLNRGDDTCKVVNQKGQFSWRAREKLYYDEDHYNLATKILTRGWAIKGFKSTHFHNHTVQPNWSGYQTTIGAHKFYYPQ